MNLNVIVRSEPLRRNVGSEKRCREKEKVSGLFLDVGLPVVVRRDRKNKPDTFSNLLAEKINLTPFLYKKS